METNTNQNQKPNGFTQQKIFHEKTPEPQILRLLSKYDDKIIIPIACMIVGGVIALQYTGVDIYQTTSRIEQIRSEIQKNNQTCIKAVESNKRLKDEYDAKIEKLSEDLARRMGVKETRIKTSGEQENMSIVEENE